MKEMVSLDISSIKYASERLKEDPLFLKDIMLLNCMCIKHFSQKQIDTISNDKVLFLNLIKKDKNLSRDFGLLNYLPEPLTSDMDIFLFCIEKRVDTLKFASDDLKDNEMFFRLAVQSNVDCLNYISQPLSKNKEFLLYTIPFISASNYFYIHIFDMFNHFMCQDEPFTIQALSSRYLKFNEWLLKKIINRKDVDLDFKLNLFLKASVSEYFKKTLTACDFSITSNLDQLSKESLLDLIKINGNILRGLKYSAKADDFNFVMSAVKSNGLALESASNRLRTDKDIVSAAIDQNGLAFEYAHFSFKSDPFYISKAFEQNEQSIKFAYLLSLSTFSPLLNNKDIIKAAIKNSCYAFKYASISLKKDIDIIIDTLGKKCVSFFDNYYLFKKRTKHLNICEQTLDKWWPNSSISMKAKILFITYNFNPSLTEFDLHRVVKKLNIDIKKLNLISILNTKISIITNKIKKGLDLSEQDLLVINIAQEFQQEIPDSIYKIIWANLINECYTLFEYAPMNLKKDKAFILQCIKINPNIFKYIDNNLRGDFSFLVQAVAISPDILRNVSKKRRGDGINSFKHLLTQILISTPKHTYISTLLFAAKRLPDSKSNLCDNSGSPLSLLRPSSKLSGPFSFQIKKNIFEFVGIRDERAITLSDDLYLKAAENLGITTKIFH